MSLRAKLFEIRDVATSMIVIAVRLDYPIVKSEERLLSHAGFGPDHDVQASYVFMSGNIKNGGTVEFTYDPFKHSDDRTLRTVHEWLKGHWGDLDSGSLIDVQYILGERPAPRVSEAL